MPRFLCEHALKKQNDWSCYAGSTRPPAGVDAQYMALSGFFVVFKYFGLRGENATIGELSKAADSHCAESFSSIQSARPEESFPETYCFRARLVEELVNMLGLHPTQMSVEGGSVSWTLGSALLHVTRILQGE